MSRKSYDKRNKRVKAISRCSNCKVNPFKCKALQSAGTDKNTAERREAQCAADFKPINFEKPIFD